VRLGLRREKSDTSFEAKLASAFYAFGLEDDPHILKREGVLYGVSIAFSEERGSQVLTIS
jgi:hypothetical protein